MRKVWYMKFDSSAVELDNILVIIGEGYGFTEIYRLDSRTRI